MPGRNVVELVLKAIDQASDTLKRTADEVKKLGTATEGAGQKSKEAGEKTEAAAQKIDKMGKAAQRSGFDMWNLSLVTTAAFGAITLAMERSIDVQQDFKNALLGLSSVATGFGQDAEAAKQAAQELAADGLMTVADAATGLKNLLAAGFSLPQAITLMERFKDSAAFGRQAHLSFGEAIRSATEGIKNGNSILVDNAGVTKNLSIMLEEAGYSAQDLMRASQDAGVRMAIFNGILRETQHQVGDAARLADTLSGQMSRASVSVKEVGIQLGNALEPFLRNTLSAITPLLGRIAEWIRLHPQLAASIGLATAALLGLAAAAATLATFVIPALSVAMGFLATPAGLALIAIGGLTVGLVAHQAALADTEKGARSLSEAQKSQVQATQEQINSLQRAGQEYANLREQIASGKLSVEEEKKAKADLMIIEQQLETALGKEGLARIKSAEDTRAAVNAELAALQEKLRAQKEALQKTLIMENEQTLAKIEATQKRIEAVEKESRAYTIWGQIMEAGEKAAIAINERLAAGEEWISKYLPEGLAEKHRQEAEKLRETAEAHRQALEALYSSERSAEIGRLAGELKKLRQGLHDVNIDVGINTGVTSSAAGAAGKHEKAVRQQSEALSEQEFELQKLEKRWAAYEAGAGEAANSISFLASKKEYLAAKIELLNGIIAETSAKLDEATQAGERDEAEIQKLTLKILDLQATQAGLRKQIAETNAEMERQTMALMQHQVAMRQLSADQQIEILRRLRAAHEENSRQAWQIDEQLARIYSDRIKAELKEIEQAYNDQLAAIDEAAEAQTASLRRQMDDIDERTRRTIQGLQAILDAMDEQDRLRDREKARSEHEKRLADLLEKRRYHELRTGKEHVRAIAEIDEQIAEENQRWAEEQARWEQDDRRRQIQEQIDHVQEQANIQKQALQDEIDRIQKNAAQQRKILQDHYKQVTRLTEEGIWDSIAAMAATNPKWFETGKQLIESLIAGIKSGQPQISTESQGILEAVRSEIASSQAQAGRAAAEAMREPKYTIPPGQYEMIDGRAAMWARQLGGILGAGVTWDEDTRTVIIGGKQFTPLWIEDGRAYVSVRQVAEELGHRVEYDNFSGNIRIYHSGGYVDKTGPAFLEEGEYVLSRQMVKEIEGGTTGEDLIAVLYEIADRIIKILERRAGIQINKLLHIEHFETADETDLEILSRELSRATTSLVAIK